MAVTTQKSTEYTNATATPIVKADTTGDKGKLRTLAFTHDQDGVGDANSTVTLGKLPAGKVKIIGGLSRFYCNWVTGSQTMDIGWEAYTDQWKVILLQLSCLVVTIHLKVETELSLML